MQAILVFQWWHELRIETESQKPKAKSQEPQLDWKLSGYTPELGLEDMVLWYAVLAASKMSRIVDE